MLTYDLTKTDGPLYKCLYECIKNDISQGKLSSGEKTYPRKESGD